MDAEPEERHLKLDKNFREHLKKIAKMNPGIVRIEVLSEIGRQLADKPANARGRNPLSSYAQKVNEVDKATFGIEALCDELEKCITL